jgi:hypothetical protein
MLKSYPMKNIIYILLIVNSSVCAQPNDTKRDFVWQMGRYCNTDTAQIARLYGIKNLNFNTNPPNQYLSCPNIIGYLLTQSHICDTLGNLELTSNGHVLYDGLGNFIDSFALDDYYHFLGRDMQQTFLILPYPGLIDEYLLLDIPVKENVTWMQQGWFQNYFYIGPRLYTHHVRKVAGQFHLVARNQPIFSDTLDFRLTACRHANGRDWWISKRASVYG